MTQVLHEGKWPGAYLVSDDIHISREVVTLAQGVIVEPGQVLGRLTASGKYVALNPSGADGSQKAMAIAYDNVDASTEEQACVVTIRHSAVKADELMWPATITDTQKAVAITALGEANIILR